MSESDNDKTRPQVSGGRPPAPGGWQDSPDSRLHPPGGGQRPPTPGPGGGGNRFDQTTRLINPLAPGRPDAPSAMPEAPPSTSDRTVIVGRQNVPQNAAGKPEAAMSDPVVGWLAVIAGPGLGSTFPLGYGRNAIGRVPGARVALMEDEQVSRNNVLYLLYDHVGRQFVATGGEGQTLAYIGDTPIIDKAIVAAYADIRVGRTILRFVPLCGPDFDWQDSAQRS